MKHIWARWMIDLIGNEYHWTQSKGILANSHIKSSFNLGKIQINQNIWVQLSALLVQSYVMMFPFYVYPLILQIINHGVSDESLSNMKQQVQEFFDLPFQEKKRWAQKPGSLEGYGQAFVTSEKQKLEWNDMIFLKTLPLQNRSLNFWPENPQEFR